MILIVMGVAGCGKSTVGKLLAQRWGCAFLEGDDYHPSANREKMAQGQPLTDGDRKPWLEALAGLVAGKIALGQDAVLACSALKQAYRDLLSGGRPEVKFLYLKGSRDLIAMRLGSRKGHYFNPALLDTQFVTLEEPTDALTVDVTRSPEDIVVEILNLIRK